MKKLFYMVLAAMVWLAPWAAMAQIFGDVEFRGNITTGAWSAPVWSAVTLTNGGTYTNAQTSLVYRLSATNRYGRFPLSTNVTVVMDATNSTAVYLTWASLGGVGRWVVERSHDAGTNFAEYALVLPSATAFLDDGNQTWVSGVFTNTYTAIAPPTAPWPATETVTASLAGKLATTGGVSSGILWLSSLGLGAPAASFGKINGRVHETYGPMVEWSQGTMGAWGVLDTNGVRAFWIGSGDLARAIYSPSGALAARFGTASSNTVEIGLPLSMGGNQITNAAAGVAATDVATVGQLADRPTFAEATNIATGVAADRPTFTESTNIATGVASDRPTFTEATNIATGVAADRPTFAEATNVANNAAAGRLPYSGAVATNFSVAEAVTIPSTAYGAINFVTGGYTNTLTIEVNDEHYTHTLPGKSGVIAKTSDLAGLLSAVTAGVITTTNTPTDGDALRISIDGATTNLYWAP